MTRSQARTTKTSMRSSWVIEETETGWKDGFYFDKEFAQGMCESFKHAFPHANFVVRKSKRNEQFEPHKLLVRLIVHPSTTLH